MLIDSLGSGIPAQPVLWTICFRHRRSLGTPPPPIHDGQGERHMPGPGSEPVAFSPPRTTRELGATNSRDCGEILEKVRRAAAGAVTAEVAETRQQNNVTWRGSSGLQRIRTGRQCGLRTTTRGDNQATSSTTATSDSIRTLPLPDQLLNPTEARHIVETFAQAMNIKLQQVGPRQAVPAARLQEALRLTIEQSALWAESNNSAEQDYQRDDRDAWKDAGYRNWVFAEANDNSHRGLKQLHQFFLDYRNYLEQGNPAAFMADVARIDNSTTAARESDLIAILDTGCNQSCHGERWLQRHAAATNTTPLFVDEVCPNFDHRHPQHRPLSGTAQWGIGTR